MTAQDLIERYIQLRDFKTAETKRFDEHIAPIVEQMADLENQLLAVLNEQGGENIRTNAGTAYKSKLMTVKIADRPAYLEYVRQYIEEQGECAMLIASAKKDEVQDYIDYYHEPPPGIEVGYMIKINVRRS